jgi:hypothetical protein
MKKNRGMSTASGSANAGSSNWTWLVSLRAFRAKKMRVEAPHTAAIVHFRHEAEQGCTVLLRRWIIIPDDDDDDAEEGVSTPATTPKPALT